MNRHSKPVDRRWRSDDGSDGAPALALVAPAKVNLALHVTGRRPDGYHLLDTVAVFAELGDHIEIAPASSLSLRVVGPFARHAPGDSTDLAWRAASAFYARTGLPEAAAIRIEKRIPAGAGLGGGSADAAAVLNGLNRLAGRPLSPEDLAATGLPLGADVPMCVTGSALRARGIGEETETLSAWPALPLVLVWPGQPVATTAAFAALGCRENPPQPEPQPAATPADVAAWLNQCRNDLEEPALRLVPRIGTVLDALRRTDGCLLARMSGSGSACFGMFGSMSEADAAAAAVSAAEPRWWVTATLAH